MEVLRYYFNFNFILKTNVYLYKYKVQKFLNDIN